MNKLPDKPSELLRVALEDMLACYIDDDHYDLNMDEWHLPYKFNVDYEDDKGRPVSNPKEGKCQVCMAGAVMAKTLKASDYEPLVPGDFNREDENKLHVINQFRSGRFADAFYMANIRENIPLIFPETYIDTLGEYEEFLNLVNKPQDNMTLFTNYILDVIAMLEFEGL